jgi:YfiH family protein
MGQVHGREVARVDRPLQGPVEGVDGLVTTTPGLTLGVLVADCVPVLLDAPGVAAVAHAGRKGVQLGVVPATLAVLAELGVAPGSVTARLGPAACGACYEVPAAMRDEVAAVAPAAASRTREGTPALDLRTGIVEQLQAAGVSRIDVSAVCTIESPAHFSYRREGTTGRFAGLIRCRPRES